MPYFRLTRLLLLCILLSSLHVRGQDLDRLTVGSDQQYLYSADGQPFFWLGDTAWELFHRLDREEAKKYLQDRADKGFTVIQAVALAELYGLDDPNAYGHTPLIDNDPARPREAYFKHVDYVIEEAEKVGLYVALLPTWGDKFTMKWGVGPEVFTPENAEKYGAFIGERYKDSPVIWVLGGDRNPDGDEDYAIINAMAKGINEQIGDSQLMTYHPQGGSNSAKFFHEADWLDFNMIQSGHREGRTPNYEIAQANLALSPQKPTIDGEPCYEDHPVKGEIYWQREEPGAEYLPWFDEYDVRVAAYQSMLAGAFGHTYGHHSIWQMWEPGLEPLSICRTPWQDALDHPGAFQMGYMRQLLEARPWHQLVADQSLVISEAGQGLEQVRAARDEEGAFGLWYLPVGGEVTVKTANLVGDSLNVYWFNPRQNAAQLVDRQAATEEMSLMAPGNGKHQDWVLVIEDAAAELPRLGTSYHHFVPKAR